MVNDVRHEILKRDTKKTQLQTHFDKTKNEIDATRELVRVKGDDTSVLLGNVEVHECQLGSIKRDMRQYSTKEDEFKHLFSDYMGSNKQRKY